jgi:hypothetical protein
MKRCAYGFKYTLVGLVRDPVFQRDIDRVVFPLSPSFIVLRTGSWEEISILVNAAGHNAVSRVKRFFDAITMMAINVDIEHARIETKKLEDTEVDIVYVAEPRGFTLLCMM